MRGRTLGTDAESDGAAGGVGRYAPNGGGRAIGTAVTGSAGSSALPSLRDTFGRLDLRWLDDWQREALIKSRRPGIDPL